MRSVGVGGWTSGTGTGTLIALRENYQGILEGQEGVIVPRHRASALPDYEGFPSLPGGVRCPGKWGYNCASKAHRW